jgi:hypothetical protein
LARDLYLPPEFFEALGRLTIARYQLEISFDILLAILAAEPSRFGVCHPREPFENKIAYLSGVSRSRLLKHEWWRALRRIALSAKKLHGEYTAAATGSIFSRGAGPLESLIRSLAEQTRVAPKSLAMTQRKIDDLTGAFTRLTRDASDLARLLLTAASK